MKVPALIERLREMSGEYYLESTRSSVPAYWTGRSDAISDAIDVVEEMLDALETP